MRTVCMYCRAEPEPALCEEGPAAAAVDPAEPVTHGICERCGRLPLAVKDAVADVARFFRQRRVELTRGWLVFVPGGVALADPFHRAAEALLMPPRMLGALRSTEGLLAWVAR